MSVYTVLYTVTIAQDVDASRAVSALDLAMSDANVERLLSAEWGRQDITRVEVIAVDGQYIPVGDGHRLAVNQ